MHDGLDDAVRATIGDHAATCDACRQLIAAALRAMPSEAISPEGATIDGPNDEPADGLNDDPTDGPIGPDAATRAQRVTPVAAPPGDDHGRVIAGKYELVRLLGAGGMGRVHEAINTWTGRRVAVKELLGAFSGEPTAASRFMLEARSASQIAHPNVVDILDLGQDPATGALYMVQELLTGVTLRQRLAERGALSVDDALRVLAPALAALVIAHAAGVIHRDLKPENIFLARDAAGGEVTKLIDFGLSKRLTADGDLALTEHGRQLGTPYYMAPEQLRGDADLDDRCDVWAIGVVLFEAVAGARPFVGPSYHELVVQILKEPIPRLTDAVPTAPAAFAALIARALERDRTRRIAMRELAAGLDELARRPDARTVPSGNPYRGLAPFEATYRGVFFGRGDDVAAVVARVRRARFVLVAGDSGVGKSSLVRAGVLPALGAPTAVTITPGARPLAAIAGALAPLVREPDSEALAAQLADDPAAVAARLAAAEAVIFVDQL
ncbi:MAG TPA: serine/threonine-protein kinase, partial [Kofleriaceae bacterium]|nr:serine/threonine-protein kinase [Kofleriaceae bacterium]